MGFGLLFLGYLFMVDFPYKGLDIFPDAAGFALMLIGLQVLREYEAKFKHAQKPAYILLFLTFIELVKQLLGFFELWQNDIFSIILTYAIQAAMLVYYYLLIKAISAIAVRTGLPKIKVRARRNLILTYIIYAVKFIFSIDIPYIKELAAKLNEIMYLTGFVFMLDALLLLLNAVLILSCYMRICRKGDEDMPVKEKKKRRKDDN